MIVQEKIYKLFMENFWHTTEGISKQHSKHFILERKIGHNEPGVYSYWWHAHELEYLVDVYLRTNDKIIIEQINSVIVNNIRLNGNTIKNDFYDDMLWNALAIERLYRYTRDVEYKHYLLTLVEDIIIGINEYCGGGMSWRKDMPWYKNTPANCPAIILFVRLYELFNDEMYLQYAKNIFDWQIENLFIQETGQVIDGMNREQNMQKDIDWKFTYCQGVFIGACVEINKFFPSINSLEFAEKAVDYAIRNFTKNDIFIPEGGDDIGLFKGILIRYLALYTQYTGDSNIKSIITKNSMLIEKTLADNCSLIGDDFSKTISECELPEFLSVAITCEVSAVI